jgi:WD40 repeat protein
MGKRVILTLFKGSFQQGFPALLRIQDDDDATASEIQVQGELPPEDATNSTLWELYDCWQRGYQHLPGIRNSRLDNEDEETEKPQINLHPSEGKNQFIKKFNEWLNSGNEDWLKIRDELNRNLIGTSEVRVIIQTKDPQLRLLPWHVWRFFADASVPVEIALSTPEFTPPPRRKKAKNDRVRILVVVGDRTGLENDPDRQNSPDLDLIKCHLNDAEIVSLIEPTPEKFRDMLWQPKGWDILFFDGHSNSDIDKATGWIKINHQDSLTIDQFKNALKTAIQNGLKIAFFNSCNGLGLANELAELQFPQIIVMRDRIHDKAARDFLRDFLTEFASHQSFYTSVLLARKKLEDAWDKKYPGVSWLPVICQNPAVKPPSWKDFLPPPSWKIKHILTGHTQPIISVAMSPDGKTIASGSQDNTIKLWNAATGELLETLTGHHSAIIALAFSPDGKILASSSNHEFNDGTIKLWDLNTRKLQQSLGASLVNLRVGSLAFSPDQQYLASGHIGFTAVDTAIRIWQIDRGKVAYTLKGHGWEVTAIAFSSDGRILVSGSADSAIMIWDWRAEKRLRTLNRPDDFFGSLASWFDQSKGIIWAIAISPDDKIIASGGSDQPIYLWNLETGKLEKSLTNHEGYVSCLAFSPDRQTLASGGKDHTIRIWNYHTGELLQTLNHLGTVNSLAFSPDGQTLVSGSWDRTVKIWHFA